MKRLIPVVSIMLMFGLPSSGHATDYKERSVSNGGSVTGKVSFSGRDPAPKVYKISKDNEVCGTGNREIDYVAVNNGALTNVVVYLDKVKEGKPFPPELSNAKIDQKGCKFKPFLQVMRNATELAAVNDDPILHNIHTYEILGRARKTVFNVSQSQRGTIKKRVALKRGNALKVECDAHDFMHGFIFVAKNPYFAVVDENGNFTIDNIPPGKYIIKAWHGKLREQKAKVDVFAGETTTINFEFKGKN